MDKKTVIAIMEQYILDSDESLKDELLEFAEMSGKLSLSDVMILWNGAKILDFSSEKQAAVYEFMRNREDLTDRIAGAEKFFLISTPKAIEPISFAKKDEFLKTIPDETMRYKYRRALYRMCSKIENTFKKDLHELSREELVAGLSMMGYTNISTLRGEGFIALSYIKWCESQGYSVPHHEDLINIRYADVPIKKALTHKFVKDAKALQEIIYYTRSRNDVNTASAVLCLYWMGFLREEILDLKKRDVDFKHMRIFHPEWGFVNIPDAFYDILFRYQHNDIAMSGPWTYHAEPSEFFLKRFVKSKNEFTGRRISRERVDSLISRFSKDYQNITGLNFSVTGTNIFDSGACWRVYQREQDGEIDLDRIIMKEARLETPRGISVFRRKYNGYKEIFYDN